MSRLIFITIFISLFDFQVFAKNGAAPDSHFIDSLFEVEFFKLKKTVVANDIFLGPLCFSDASPSHVDPNNWSVIINRGEIDKYLKGKNVDTVLLIKFVLSHEVAHLVELFEWGIAKPAAININVIPFLESEADVISGYLIKAVFNKIDLENYIKANPNGGFISYELAFVHRIPNFYQEILSFSDVHVGWRSHQSNSERITAIRDGLIYGEFATNRFMMMKPNRDEYDPEANKTVHDLLFNNEEFGYGIHPLDDKFAWAARKALLICHGNELDGKNLIVFDRVVEWDTSRAHHCVNYSFEIYNQGKVPVAFYGLAVVEEALRLDPNNYSQRLYIDDSIYHKTLYPNHYVKFSGKLDYWHGKRQYLADFAPGNMTKFMPVLVLPGDQTSFYWTFNSDLPRLRNQRIETFDTHFGEVNDFGDDDIIDLIFSVLPYRGNLFGCARGMGLGQSKDHDSIYNHTISYNSVFNDEGGIYSNGMYLPVVYGVNLFASHDEIRTTIKFDKVIGIVKKTFPYFRFDQTSEGKRRLAAFSEKGVSYIFVEFNFNQSDSKYYVTLNIIGSTMVAPDDR